MLSQKEAPRIYLWGLSGEWFPIVNGDGRGGGGLPITHPVKYSMENGGASFCDIIDDPHCLLKTICKGIALYQIPS